MEENKCGLCWLLYKVGCPYWKEKSDKQVTVYWCSSYKHRDQICSHESCGKDYIVISTGNFKSCEDHLTGQILLKLRSGTQTVCVTAKGNEE